VERSRKKRNAPEQQINLKLERKSRRK